MNSTSGNPTVVAIVVRYTFDLSGGGEVMFVLDVACVVPAPARIHRPNLLDGLDAVFLHLIHLDSPTQKDAMSRWCMTHLVPPDSDDQVKRALSRVEILHSTAPWLTEHVFSLYAGD